MELRVVAATHRNAHRGDWTLIAECDEHTLLDTLSACWSVILCQGMSLYKIVDVVAGRDWHGPVTTGV